MEGKAVQLVQGRDKELDAGDPLQVLERFSAFSQTQVIDLDAALGKGSNDGVIRHLAARATIRVGGGIRSVTRAKELVACGACRVIVGTAAYTPEGVNHLFLETLSTAIGRHTIVIALDSREGRIVVRGWRESTQFTAEQVMRMLDPYCSGYLCTYVDKEGMMQGTDLDWFRRLRAGTLLELTAAGGITTIEEVRELLAMNVNVALGMALYTGRLSMDELLALNR